MIDAFPFYNSDIWLTIFFMRPQVTKHFSMIAITRHSVLPRFCYVWIMFENVFSQKLQATSVRFILYQKIIINWTKHICYFFATKNKKNHEAHNVVIFMVLCILSAAIQYAKRKSQSYSFASLFSVAFDPPLLSALMVANLIFNPAILRLSFESRSFSTSFFLVSRAS